MIERQFSDKEIVRINMKIISDYVCKDDFTDNRITLVLYQISVGILVHAK